MNPKEALPLVRIEDSYGSPPRSPQGFAQWLKFPEHIIKRTSGRPITVYLLALLLLAPVVDFPHLGTNAAMRVIAIQTIPIALLAFFLFRITWSAEKIREFLSTGSNLPLLLFVAWPTLQFVTAPPATGWEFQIAQVELLRLGSGGAVYFAALYVCRSRRELRLISLLIISAGILVGASGILSYSPSTMQPAKAALGNKQLLGAFLAVLLPIALALAQAHLRTWHRWLAWTALGVAGTGLLLTGNRTSWIAALAGMSVVAMLAPCRNAFRTLLMTARRRAIAACVALAVLSGTLAISPVGPMIQGRFNPNEASWAIGQRLPLWSACWHMFSEKPLTGWGAGSFSAKAGEYTIYAPSPAQVQTQGPSLSSVAHSEYLQIAAETGVAGLAFYLWTLGIFFIRGFRSLSTRAFTSRKLVLLGTLGALSAQCIDALANPGWHYSEVSLLLWLVLGIGTSAARPEVQGQECQPAPVLPPCPFRGVGRAAFCVIVTAGLPFLCALGIVGGAVAIAQYVPLSHYISFYCYQPVATTGQGHAFLQLSPISGPQGSSPNLVYGLYPAKKRIPSSAGVVKNDSFHPWHWRIRYPLTTEQYNIVASDICQTIGSPPGYFLYRQVAGLPLRWESSNSVDWIQKKASLLGIVLPPLLNERGIADPLAFCDSLEALFGTGGGTFRGGVVERNISGIRPNGSTVAAPPPALDLSFAALESTLHTDPAGIALRIGLRNQERDLGTFVVNITDSFRVRLSNINPAKALTSIDWGDGTDLEDLSTQYAHRYTEPGVYEVKLVIVNSGAVITYRMSVSVILESTRRPLVHVRVPTAAPIETLNTGFDRPIVPFTVTILTAK